MLIDVMVVKVHKCIMERAIDYGQTERESTCIQMTGQVTQQYFRELVQSVNTSDDRVTVMPMNYSREQAH